MRDGRDGVVRVIGQKRFGDKSIVVLRALVTSGRS